MGSTLHDLITTGKSFSGRGRVIGKYFSMSEEKMLAEKMRSLVIAGHELTWASMLDIVKQELCKSGRSQITPNVTFVRRFAKRHNLINHVKKVNNHFSKSGPVALWKQINYYTE